MKTIFSLLSGLAFTFSFSQKTQNVGDFSSLEIYDQISVELISSDRNYIEISGSNSENVQVVSKNNKLKIRMKLDQFLKGNKTTVKVYYQSVNGIYVREGASVISKQTITSPSLTLNANKGGTINVGIEANSVEVRIDSGGFIEAKGTSNSQNVVVNSGGNYEGGKLVTKTTNVTINAGGDAEIYATDYVNAKTRAGGTIEIYGGAEVNQTTFAGGTINIH